jgi:hypothetical protein
MTYLILWFAIPSAKSARQKLEMEGEPISARTIAERQGATQEEKAKSSVASAVTTVGRFVVIVMKVLLGLMLFPITFAVFGLLLSLIVITAGVSELFIVDIGNFAGLVDAANEVSISHNTKIFNFIFSIQEEVHRFTFSAMDKKRRKSVTRLSLENVKGIGPTKAQNLMKHFKSVKNIKAATADELIKVKGIREKDANEIIEYYKKT